MTKKKWQGAWERKKSRAKYLRQTIKRCFYCKCDLVYYPLANKERVPDNYATIEHLNSRLQYPNGRPNVYGQSKTLVVACSKCNNERSTKETALLSLDELHERASRHSKRTEENS